jgi:ParB/RepB/Spo0J family partition protein
MKKTNEKMAEPEIYPVRLISVDSIDPSPANKRRFTDNDKSLRELGDSVEAQGLLHAVIVRKSPAGKGRFELVSGERRWRAYLLKEWKKIPAVIRELSDTDAYDITVSENLQREDLSPIEEAESIKVLLADGRDAKEIADRIGKPVSWVVRRARIADLSKKWLNAIADPKHPLSKWSSTHLELIARYDHAKQDELFDGGLGKKWNMENVLLTVKDLEKTLNKELLSLSGVPWKSSDETLLPAAGACTQCQKRTSCSPSLFEPIEETKSRGDRCLDRDCWGRKLTAHHLLGIKNAREEHGDRLLLIDKGGSSLPSDHPWKKLLAESYKYDSAKKGDKDAVPAYIVDGPGSGRVEYFKLQDWYRGSKKTRPIGADGKPEPKPLEERREGLEKRRVIRFINKLMMILTGEDENVQRVNIGKGFSNVEMFALVSAFGAAQLNEETQDSFGELDRWNVYRKICKLNGQEALIDAMYCVFDRIVDQLRQLTYCPKPDIDFPNNLCAALRLDHEAIWNKVLEEIPEPKAWAKLEGHEAPKTVPKKKKLSDLVDEEIAADSYDTHSVNDLPATRYNYQEKEIFVSAGLGGKQYGTFRVSNGGSGVKRIVSKNMPMISDRKEAQRNLDKFAKDNHLTGV